MKKELTTNLAYTIIELQILKKNMKGAMAVTGHFQLKKLVASIWHDMIKNINHQEIVTELSQNEKLKKDFMMELREHGELKDLVFFGLALNMLDKSAVIKAAEMSIAIESCEAATSLIFAAKNLNKEMSKESQRWAKEAKNIALENGCSEIFLEAVDFLNQAAKKEELLHLLTINISIIVKQEKQKMAGKLVLPECKKCLELLQRFPKKEQEDLKKIIFQ